MPDDDTFLGIPFHVDHGHDIDTFGFFLEFLHDNLDAVSYTHLLKGKYIRIKYVTQLPSKTPTFAFYCNLPQYVKEPYKRFLENKIREHWKFTGVPIQIYMRKK